MRAVLLPTGVLLLACGVYLMPWHRVAPQPRVVTVTAAENESTRDRLPAPTSAEPSPTLTKSHAVVAGDPSSPSASLPDAITHNESPQTAPPAQPRPVTASRPQKPEVVIRVSVDQQGNSQNFEVVQGDQRKISAALHAAKRYHFQPCSGLDACEHLLKFTDYGDASVLRSMD